MKMLDSSKFHQVIKGHSIVIDAIGLQNLLITAVF